ncbi:unnamed protein product [Brassica oleracea]
MDSSGNTLKVKTPINKKLEKEGEEEDGFTTPKGAQFKIPPLLQCPPAPVRGGIQQKTPLTNVGKYQPHGGLPPSTFKI